MNGKFNFRGPNPVRIRCCQYLNNVVEQDHRRVKGRVRPMLGFKTFYNARRVIIGIELVQKIHKRQFPAGSRQECLFHSMPTRCRDWITSSTHR